MSPAGRGILKVAPLLALALAVLLASACGDGAGTSAMGKITFTFDRFGNRDMYVTDVGGSTWTYLTTVLPWDSFPIWSPDGTRIAFYSDRDGNGEVYVMNADGSGLTRLTNDP